MHQPPSAVRAWPDEDVLGIVAEAELEKEEDARRPAGAGGSTSVRAASPHSQRTVLYRVGPRPKE